MDQYQYQSSWSQNGWSLWCRVWYTKTNELAKFYGLDFMDIGNTTD